VSEQKKPGPGKGPTNLSGARGASPVIRFRAPAELKAVAEEKAERTGEDLAEVMRELLRRWVARK